MEEELICIFGCRWTKTVCLRQATIINSILKT